MGLTMGSCSAVLGPASVVLVPAVALDAGLLVLLILRSVDQ
jgi:hypothetical protein